MEQEVTNYSELSNIFLSENFQKFNSVMDEYLIRITKLMDSMTGESSEERKEATLDISKWLNENMEKNPLSKEA